MLLSHYDKWVGYIVCACVCVYISPFFHMLYLPPVCCAMMVLMMMMLAAGCIPILLRFKTPTVLAGGILSFLLLYLLLPPPPSPLFRIGQVMLIGSACVFSFRVSCWSASLWQRLPNSIPMTKNILVSRAFFIKRCVLFLSFFLSFLRFVSFA